MTTIARPIALFHEAILVSPKHLLVWSTLSCCGIALVVSYFSTNPLQGGGTVKTGILSDDYQKRVSPILKKYCLECHSKKAHKGDLDLERFDSLAAIRKDLKPWQHLIEQVEVGEMPPKGKPQPTAEERKVLLGWVRAMLDAEARARVGDPGHVPLRRLSNTEYDCTIRDLTGVDLKPTREFPADGAAGEGFTNAAESLSDITPTLFTRYLEAAKEVADHAVLLPEGFRFSPGKTRRDWTDESTARLRKFYAKHTADGRLAFQPYLLATVRHRESLVSGKSSLAEVAGKEKLNAKYLRVLWDTLNDKTASFPLDQISARWRDAGEKDIPGLVADITDWQKALWNFVPIGSYRYGAMTRQVAGNVTVSETQSIKLAVKPAPGQNDVSLFLATRELSPGDKDKRVVWQRPRFEAPGKPPLLLKDYAKFGSAFEVDHATIFIDASRYLSAAAKLTKDGKQTADELAQKSKLDPALLQRWIAVLALESLKKETAEPPLSGPAAPITLLDQKTPKNEKFPPISGWRRAGVDLPVFVSNASDTLLKIPGTARPRKILVHPTPAEFVAAQWKSPVSAKVAVTAHIMHAHPTCGNGVAWWLEQRQGSKATNLGQGVINLGGNTTVPARTIQVEPGDRVVLAIDARDRNHSCDLTEITLTLSEPGKDGRVWDLAGDVANTIQSGNPHADKHGNKDVWSFVRGPSKATGKTPGNKGIAAISSNSLLGQWRIAVVDPARSEEADKLASQVQTLLTGARPTNPNDPNRALYDAIVPGDGVLLKGLDLARFARPRPAGSAFGLAQDRFDGENLITPANMIIEVHLPAALLRERQFVVEGRFDGSSAERLAVFDVATDRPSGEMRWNAKSPLVGSAASAVFKKMQAGFDDFRQVFPWYLCFPNVVPTDEVVSLKMFHREDEPLERLFLDAKAKREIDHSWSEHRFISRQPVAENDYLPQFIGYVTQDQPKQLLNYFESQRPVFKKRADEFTKDALAAEPKHLTALTEFAERAFRRPIDAKEKADLLTLYQKIRKKGVSHEEAFRGVLTRVLVAPAFLFRIEKAPPGKQAAPIDDWELASRLSYFLWSSTPDDELRGLAVSGKLRDPKVLAEQTQRMLKDSRLRAFAIEFGTQWIHVRNFDSLKEKNEKLFPTFNPALRSAIYEESILFFQDLFQSDRAVTQILDADHTFLNETLAKHYGIPGVKGPQWRKVDAVRKFGRGGILGLASVHAKQSGASRTSPVLRGNWVVETLLGEKLPRPPANVPAIPDEEGAAKRTTRQQVERHVSDPSCAACHVRIDPYGFAFENFDAIGRFRVKEVSGLPVDTKAKLRDGTEFEGIDGLRTYLLTKKKDVVVRLFCQRLLGYALGRATTLSDTALIDEMVAELNRNEGRISAAVLAIVHSPQFRMVRGSEFAE